MNLGRATADRETRDLRVCLGQDNGVALADGCVYHFWASHGLIDTGDHLLGGNRGGEDGLGFRNLDGGGESGGDLDRRVDDFYKQVLLVLRK
jgi:hypothetical protein